MNLNICHLLNFLFKQVDLDRCLILNIGGKCETRREFTGNRIWDVASIDIYPFWGVGYTSWMNYGCPVKIHKRCSFLVRIEGFGMLWCSPLCSLWKRPLCSPCCSSLITFSCGWQTEALNFLVAITIVQEDLGKLTSTGEMTYCFIQAIERGYGSTYGSLLNAMRSAIHMAEDQVVTSLIDMLLKGGSYEGGDTPVSDPSIMKFQMSTRLAYSACTLVLYMVLNMYLISLHIGKECACWLGNFLCSFAGTSIDLVKMFWCFSAVSFMNVYHVCKT